MESAIPQRNDALTFSIGGINISLVSDDRGLELGVNRTSAYFLAPGADPDATVRARWGELREPVTGDSVFESGSLWRLYRQQANHLFRFASPVYGAIPYKEVRFNPDFSVGELSLHGAYFRKSEPLYPLEYPLDELLVMNLLAQGRGVELHACGVEDSDGRGYLFLGQSGAGKTTTARLWQTAADAHILSDDRIILRSLEGKIWMYGTPWHGEAELASAARTPLTQVFFLRHAPENQIVALRPAQAVSRLMACSFVPFYSAGGLDFSLEFMQRIAEAVPCAELRFAPDAGAVDFARNAVQHA